MGAWVLKFAIVCQFVVSYYSTLGLQSFARTKCLPSEAGVGGLGTVISRQVTEKDLNDKEKRYCTYRRICRVLVERIDRQPSFEIYNLVLGSSITESIRLSHGDFA